MNDIVAQIKEYVKDITAGWDDSHAGKVYIDLKGTAIASLTRYLTATLGCRFITITAVDVPEGIELLYHFSHDASGMVLSFRILLADKKHPAIESISSLFVGSHWIEREVHELMGVDFIGNNGQHEHLVLPTDWPEGVYPLRRDFQS